MANFGPKDIKKLREMTEAGMMDCKKALTETDGDMDKAVAWLRDQGMGAAAKKAGKTAAEGSIAVKVEGKKQLLLRSTLKQTLLRRMISSKHCLQQ